jgi:hypothetical protein
MLMVIIYIFIAFIMIFLIYNNLLNDKIIEGNNGIDKTKDCLGVYDKYYGECSKTCGGGIQTIPFSITQAAEDGFFRGNKVDPIQCPMPLERVCNTHNCPIDCKYVGGGDGWGNWLKNLDSNGDQIGTETKTREILIKDQFGGIPCGKLTETQTHKVDCVQSAWSNWGACSKTCGGGTQEWKRSTLQESKNGGKPCGKLRKTTSCNTDPCPINCVLGSWTNEGGCSKTCGSGEMQQTNAILTNPAHGGKACGPRRRTVKCIAAACPINGIRKFKGGRSGKFCADEGNRIVCNRGAVGSWEKFNISRFGDKYLLRGRSGKFCADEGNRIVCNRHFPGAWEKFNIVKHGDKYVLIGGRYGKYCADESGGIVCNRDTVGAWETFTLI